MRLINHPVWAGPRGPGLGDRTAACADAAYFQRPRLYNFYPRSRPHPRRVQVPPASSKSIMNELPTKTQLDQLYFLTQKLSRYLQLQGYDCVSESERTLA